MELMTHFQLIASAAQSHREPPQKEIWKLVSSPDTVVSAFVFVRWTDGFFLDLLDSRHRVQPEQFSNANVFV